MREQEKKLVQDTVANTVNVTMRVIITDRMNQQVLLLVLLVQQVVQALLILMVVGIAYFTVSHIIFILLTQQPGEAFWRNSQ